MSMRRWILILNLVPLFAAGLWLRASSLGTIPELHGDEAWFGVQAQRWLAGELYELRTYSENPLNPFYVGVLPPLLRAFGPTPWVVRLPIMLSGVLAVGAFWLLMRKPLGTSESLIAAGLLATMPAAIVLSRVGFDCGQQPLIAVIALALAFRGMGFWLVVATAASLVIHPTSLYLLPITALVYLTQVGQRGDLDSRAKWRILAATTALCLVAAVIIYVPARSRPYVVKYAASFYHPPDWPRFLGGFARFLLGLSLPPHEPHLLHQWIVMTSPEAEARQVGTLGVGVVCLLIFGGWKLGQARRWDRLALIAATMASAAVLHLTAGATVMESTYRYAAIFVAPLTLSLAVLAAPLVAARPWRVALLVVVGWGLIAAAKTNFFDPRLKNSPERLRTLVDDAPDSYREIIRSLGPDENVLIAQSYWSFYTLTYYAPLRPGLRVERVNPTAIFPSDPQPGLVPRLRTGAVAVGFRDGGMARAVAESGESDQIDRRVILLNGKRWIDVFRWKTPRVAARR